jgi:hypothetical protein
MIYKTDIVIGILILIVFSALLITQLTDYSTTVDSCHSGDFFKLRGKVYKCLWVGGDEFINGGGLNDNSKT